MAVRLRLMAVKIDWSMTLISGGNCSKGPALCKTGENVTQNNISIGARSGNTMVSGTNLLTHLFY